jgi:MIP family channel proteins
MKTLSKSVLVSKKRMSLLKSIFHCPQEMTAEAIGTFILVFAGTGAVMVNQISGGAITHLGISFVFGAVVAALIYGIGHLSGAHFNPAVTLAFWSSGFFAKRSVLPYIVAQSVGAIAASALLLVALGPVAKLGATLPLDGNWLQSLVLETVLTFILMFVILGSGLDRRAHIGFAGLAIGLTVGLEAAFMGPITGASMNPARSLGPALISGIWQHHWVYWVAPILGAQLAVIVYRYLSNGFRDIQ